MPPSSAWTSARMRIAIPPIAHEMIAAGPAVASAPWAPNNQPEPMIDPSEAQIRPTNPISLLSPGRARAMEVGVGAVVAILGLPTLDACPGRGWCKRIDRRRAKDGNETSTSAGSLGLDVVDVS